MANPNSADPRPKVRRWAVRLSILYLACLVAIWIVFWAGADEDVWPTLILFGPRWPVFTPLVILLPMALFSRSRLAGVLGVISTGIALGPITGGTFSVGSAFAGEPKSYRLRIVSLNCGGGLVKKDLFEDFIIDTKPDIIATQETPPEMKDWLKGWHSVQGISGTWIFSKYPLTALPQLDKNAMEGKGGAAGAVVETPMVSVPVFSLHLITARPGLEAFLSNKLNGLDRLRNAIRARDIGSQNTKAWVGDAPSGIIAGDFNMPVESRIYQRDWAKFRNAYSDAGNGFGLTFHTRLHGVRIDHVLFAKPWSAHAAWVGADVGSDHWPEVAELTFDPN